MSKRSKGKNKVEEVSERSENMHMSTKESTMKMDLIKIMMKVWLIAATLGATASWGQAQQPASVNQLPIIFQLNANGDIVAFPNPLKNGRLYWDSLFRKIGMQVNGVWLPNILAWLAVVCFGCGAWRRHRKDCRTATKPQTSGQCSPSQ